MLSGDYLKIARERAGINRREAARQCGVSYSSYEKWERNDKPMQIPMLVGCLILLGESADRARAIAIMITTDKVDTIP